MCRNTYDHTLLNRKEKSSILNSIQKDIHANLHTRETASRSNPREGSEIGGAKWRRVDERVSIESDVSIWKYGGEKRPYRVLIAVVTIYSVERQAARRGRLIPCEETPPSISPLEIKRKIQFYLSLVLTPRHEEGRTGRSEIPAPGRYRLSKERNGGREIISNAWKDF